MFVRAEEPNKNWNVETRRSKPKLFPLSRFG